MALFVALAGLLAQFATAASGSTSAATAPVLVVDNVYNNNQLDPQIENSQSADLAFHAMYETLVTFDGTNFTDVLPDLATSWTVAPNAKSITFNLRKNAKFSDGTPVTAKDVYFSYERLINLKDTNSFLLAGVTVKAVGDYQVVLTSSTPNPALLRITATPALSIDNSAAMEANGGTDAADAAKADHAESYDSHTSVGSGPYMLSNFIPNQEIDMVPNPYYWGPKPAFSKIVIRNMNSTSQELNVQRGTDEIATDIPPTLAASLSSNKNLQVVSGPGSDIFYLTVNEHTGVTQAANPLIIEAIRYGLDYKSIEQLGGPQTQPLAGMMPYGLLGALPPSDALAPNVTKAKALVSQYEKANGGQPPSFVVDYVEGFSFAGVNLQTEAESVQSSLEALGMKVSLSGQPIGPFLANRAKQQVIIGLQSMDYPDPQDYVTQYCPGEPQAGYVGYVNATAAKICTLAEVTTSDSLRAKYMAEYERQLDADSPYIPIMQPPDVRVATANLTGINTNPIWAIDLTKIGVKS
jgi:peptide/nickel transport system substrate-binding protein